jgi:hypothetical protein
VFTPAAVCGRNSVSWCPTPPFPFPKRVTLEEVTGIQGVRCRGEIQYSDGMDAVINVDGAVSRARDMSTEELLQLVDLAFSLADRGPG